MIPAFCIIQKKYRTPDTDTVSHGIIFNGGWGVFWQPYDL